MAETTVAGGVGEGNRAGEQGSGWDPMRAEVDLEALETNLRAIQDMAGPGTCVLASIKGNAYGHGVLRVAEALRGKVFGLATGDVDEAVAVRERDPSVRIVLFGSYLERHLPAILDKNLIPTVFSEEMARAVSRVAKGPASVWIKVDVGLGRLGVPLAQARQEIKRIAGLPNLAIEGLYTHAPFGDEPGHRWAADKIRRFDAVVADLQADGLEIPVIQARASSAVLAEIPDSCNCVCVGHILYGVPTFDSPKNTAHLRPVLKSLRSDVIHVQTHQAGADLAIGGYFQLPAGKTIGVLPIGLANGLRRAGPDRCRVLVRGQRVPVVGVALEHAVVDLTNTQGASVGDECTLIGRDGGEEITLQEYADMWGTSPLEALLAVGSYARLHYRNRAADIWAAFGAVA